MQKTLILIVVLLIVIAPMLTSALPAVCGPADVAVAAEEGGDDDEAMSYWDWLVVWWTTNWQEWPVF